MNPHSDSSGPTKIRRMLAAVAFIDVVNFSVQMAQDETATHTRWMAILHQVIEPKAESHGGTVIKSTGDGVLATFPCVLDAVEWAQDVQREMAASAQIATAPPPITLRMSVHLGDVIVVDDDIYGDGVNVAARLLDHAASGCVALSEAVYDLVRGTAGGRARDIGLQYLKNFEKPVRIYVLEPVAPVVATRAIPRGGSVPSIAVLPFRNLGPGVADDYFADGIAEDIAISLGHLGELFVISRGSTLSFRGREVDPREVGHALGVRYVLLGSVRISPRLIRVSTQLCDAMSGINLWSETTEVQPGDLFEVQDRIVTRIVTGIAPSVRVAELRGAMRKRPDSFSAYDCMLRALHIINALDRAAYPQARDLLAQAMDADPFFAMPFAWCAFWHLVNVGQGWATDPASDIAQSGALAARAIEIDQQNALALSIYGHVKSYLFRQYDVGELYLEQALRAGPNNPLAWILSAATLAYTGRGEQAVRHAEHGLRLSPLDRSLYFTHNVLAIAHYANENLQEAVRWSRLSRSENPAFSANHRILIASLAGAGELEEARIVAAELLRLEPSFELSVWERTLQPFRDQDLREKHVSRLRMVLSSMGGAGPRATDNDTEGGRA